MKKKSSSSSPTKAKIIKGSLKLISKLPFYWSRQLGKLLGHAIWLSQGRNVQVTRKNLQLCYPDLSAEEIEQKAKESCLHSGMLITETAWIWNRPGQDIVRYIDKVTGAELITEALQQNKGIIFTGPHLGNWESFAYWCTEKLTTHAMYRIPKIKELDPVIRESREKSGIKMILAEASGVRSMLKVLKQGEGLVILSDQSPVENSGVYAPFFQHSAYTMVLLQRLLKKTQCELFFFSSIRTQKGFNIELKKANFDTQSESPEEFAEESPEELVGGAAVIESNTSPLFSLLPVELVLVIGKPGL